ncbi:OmpA family protein [Methylobacter sp.]|uniref:OmpA family protein n=1 Tax=Methylobacter sp. TaxID=2051955 RepID=UPI0012051959|nr:OmpA family protein [Methylobacter sp.]TAK62967.1 MAG: flagellar motor protein MotB [Methylobacter sp.]
MKKTLIIAAAITYILISGCASQPTSTFETFRPQDLNGLISSGQYIQKTDNFYVINDSSSSMADKYLGADFPAQPSPTKFSVEKEILNRINLTIPDLKLTAGIRSFGFGPCLGWKFTRLNLPLISYSKPPFGSGIDTMTCASGGTPLDSAIEESVKDLSTTTGNIAMLILSDGGVDTDPVPAVKSLKQRYGDRLCVYTVWVGNKQDEYGQTVLNQLSDVAGCGFGTTANRISSPEGMTNFVKSVFLKPGTLPLTDCSRQDDDADGIDNCRDKCPNTPKGAHVNQFGCWIVDIKFGNNQSNIRPQYYSELDNAATVIKNNPGVNIEVQGHTSSTGTVEHNQRLSERRALAVKNYLSRKTHAGGLTVRGYGLTQPIDTNETEAGRSNNRRVQLEVLK